MAETSNIAWTKSTFNPWIGCSKVSPGCDSCYAEALDLRHRWGGTTHWGAGKARHRTSTTYWHKPEIWNKVAPMSEFAGRKGFWPVFCASLADVFDNEVADEWRSDLWALIEKTPNLSWLLVTKRVGNVPGMVHAEWMRHCFPENVRLLITVVNQEEADRDIPKLLGLPCKNGISYEPAIGPVDWAAWLYPDRMRMHGTNYPVHVRGERCIEWLIIGGESAQGRAAARPFNITWARSTIAQCKAAGVPAFMKQLGSSPWFGTTRDGEPHIIMVDCKDRAGADPDEWPHDLRLREFPE